MTGIYRMDGVLRSRLRYFVKDYIVTSNWCVVIIVFVGSQQLVGSYLKQDKISFFVFLPKVPSLVEHQLVKQIIITVRISCIDDQRRELAKVDFVPNIEILLYIPCLYLFDFDICLIYVERRIV